ncbi:L-methionine/branched-chain amino acid transporter [Shewanella cyperi]|uniref:L-methionine/branched-chain amino acid transporter n=1 Tax=Shewanella cyperi TaxID=2814292 RepID=A0A975AKP2_9GAMM|nr:L-methionine/branched-chain amino acid transporter [Shewanella cyperi]QSX29941.1 L-methionine/branched-chain amino acid transporter [Shewanella cyperi]QSX40718.1 L-methionine/branched-chain amino acid transporter [Shewanella cyperi]
MEQISGTIGRWQGAGLMATTLLGTGVFILPQMTLELAGSGALLAWILLTLAIIPVTLVFGRLASRFPHAAGPAFFVEKAFGRTLGRTIGLIFLLVVPMGAPAAILMTFQFVTALIPLAGWGLLLAQLLVIFGLWLANLKGLHLSAKAQFGLTLGIVTVVLALLSAFGVQGGQVELTLPELSLATSPVMAAAGIAFWSFLGVEAMTHLANDFREPQKDMIPAMMLGTVLVGLIYVVCTALLMLVPSEAPVAMMGVFDTLLGGGGAKIIGILGIASGLATVNVYSGSAARLLWSFSREGITPRWFGKLNSHGVPVRALTGILGLMAFVLSLCFLFGQELEHLIAWSNGVFVIIYLLSMLAAWRLLGRECRPWIILGLLFCIGMAAALGERMAYALMLVAIVAPILWWQKSHLAKIPASQG